MAAQAPCDVLIVSPQVAIGGTSRVVQTLAAEFNGRGIRTVVLVPSTAGPEFMAWMVQPDVPVVKSWCLRERPKPRSFTTEFFLTRTIRRFAPKAVNLQFGLNYVRASDARAIRAAGVKRLIGQVHHPVSPEETTPKDIEDTRAAWPLLDRLVATTPYLVEVMKKVGADGADFTVVPPCLPPLPNLPTRTECRAEVNLPEDKLIVGSLSRLDTSKRIDDLLTAVTKIPGFADRAILAIGGGGAEEGNLAARIRSEGLTYVRMLGHVPDAYRYLSTLDVFCLPSELEGFGLVYLEAAQVGVCAVATRSGGVPYAVKDEETGLLAPVGDTEEIARQIGRLLDDASLRERLSKAARARTLSDLSAKRMADDYEKLLLGPLGPP